MYVCNRQYFMVRFRRLFQRIKLAAYRMSLVYHHQCFKMAALSFFPFGKEVVYAGGAGSAILNFFWMIFSGIPLALEHFLWGLLLSITIIGIPFGKQQFKLAKLALCPFGADIIRK